MEEVMAIRITRPDRSIDQYAVYEHDSSYNSALRLPFRRRGYLTHTSLFSSFSAHDCEYCEALVASIFALFDPFDVAIWRETVEGEERRAAAFTSRRYVVQRGDSPFDALMKVLWRAYRT